MLGGLVMVLVLVVILPVTFTIIGAVIAAVLGRSLWQDGEARARGSELIELNQ